MSDLISIVNNYSQLKNVSTVSSPVQSMEVSENKQNENKKTMNKTAVLSGAAVLTATAATGIYLVIKGKAQKAKQLQEELQKQFLKFEKGKAIANSGEPFSGQITRELKDGTNVLLDYEKGILKQSTKFKDEQQISKKVYTYNEQGKLTKITDGDEGCLGKTFLIKYKNKKGFDVVSNTHGTIYTNNQTNEVICNLKKVKDGDYIINTKYFKDGKLKYEDDGGVLKFYKEDGKTVDFCRDEREFWVDSDGVSYIETSSFEDVVRNNCDSSYGFAYGLVEGNFKKRVPKRYIEKCSRANIIPNDLPQAKNKVAWTMNQYKLYFSNAAGEKTVTVFIDLSKEILVKGNAKRTLDGACVLFRLPKGAKWFEIIEKNGKIHIENNDRIEAVFNPKTNTFENLNIPEEEAKKVLDFAKKGIEQLKKDRKDYLKMEKLKSKMFKLKNYIDDIERSDKV